MKTISIDLTAHKDLKRFSWILFAFLNAIGIDASKHDIVYDWQAICSGERLTYNPFCVYMRNSILYFNNKNDCRTFTSNQLLQFEYVVKLDLEEFVQ